MPKPQMDGLETMTRYVPSVNPSMASALCSGESLPRTSTASGIAAARALDSSFSSHHTHHWPGVPFTFSAIASTFAGNDSRLARRTSWMPSAGTSNSLPSSGDSDVGMGTLTVLTLSSGRSYPLASYPMSWGLDSMTAHVAIHR